jgi:hypothetical protein
MGVLYVEDLASHDDPESCVVLRKGGGEALTGGRVGWVLSREIAQRSGCRRREKGRKAISCSTPSQVECGPCAVEDPMHARTHLVWEPGDPMVALGHQGRIAKSQDARR